MHLHAGKPQGLGMFTGIIETVGKLLAKQNMGGDIRLRIGAPNLDWSDVQLGDSVATNGVCLTVINLLDGAYEADVSIETLEATTAKNWTVGQAVNLEKALTPSARLGGHMVSGHVDGIGDIVERFADARSVRFKIKAPDELAKYIANKGSITVDGTSLTINKVDGAFFEMNIVPHTLENTIIDAYSVGSMVNLEVDLIARYLERLLLGDKASKASEKTPLTEAFLAENGFLK